MCLIKKTKKKLVLKLILFLLKYKLSLTSKKAFRFDKDYLNELFYYKIEYKMFVKHLILSKIFKSYYILLGLKSFYS